MQKLGQEPGWTERPKAVAREHSDNVAKRLNVADFVEDISGIGFDEFTKPGLIR